MSGISRFRRQAQATVAVVLALVFSLSTVLLANAQGQGVTILKLNNDTYTNGSSQHHTQVEPDTFAYGSTIVMAVQSGRFYDGGSSNIGWATSTDNGTTWQHGFLPGTTVYATPKGQYSRISDPSVAYDAAHGVWLISGLALLGASGAAVLVSSSTDGVHWNKPVTVVSNGGNGFYDKDWIVCDDTSSSPYYGHCYVEWDDAANGDLIHMNTSTNGGKGWGSTKSTGDFACGLGGQPLVQPNGNVIVPIDDCFESTVLAFRSTNGGNSWSSTVGVANINSSNVGGNLRAGPLVSAAVDGGGKVYVVWHDCRFENGCGANDIVMSTSTDGVNWSSVQRIPIDPVNSGIDHFVPGIDADKSTSGSSAHLALTFYYFASGQKLFVGYVSSTTGGSTWSTKTQVTPSAMQTSWLANTNQGYMFGDYISTSIINGVAFPGFVYALAPKGGKYREALYTASGGLPVAGGSLASRNDRVVAGQVAIPVRHTAY